MNIKRIIWHWTAGTNSVSSLDRQHYHEIIDGRGDIYKGARTPEDNINISDGKYAAHTLNCNTGAIGLAVAGMHGARERPFSWGPYPINEVQIDKLVERTAYYCDRYGIPVSRETVLSHAEVQPTLGIKQNGKWDIMVLPGMDKAVSPLVVGDILRDKVEKRMRQSIPKTSGGFFDWLRSLFG